LTGVRSGSPADTAGLKAGDVIISFAGSSIRNLDDLSLALRSTRAGDRVDFVYLRDGSEHSGSATLEERK
jgi:S1-C subfamily serine protease